MLEVLERLFNGENYLIGRERNKEILKLWARPTISLKNFGDGYGEDPLKNMT